MIKIENTHVDNIARAVYSARNAMNSWDKSDSNFETDTLGNNDLDLAKRLVKAGSDHSKFMRMIAVTADVTAPLYWWKEADTYKVGTVRNSCSTMHKICEKEFSLDDFSHEHLINMFEEPLPYSENEICCFNGIEGLEQIVDLINCARVNYLQTKDKKYWWQIIQLLPSSYNQKATLQLNYQVLRNMYHARKNHKLDEWHTFCDWIETLPYFELITE